MAKRKTGKTPQSTFRLSEQTLGQLDQIAKRIESLVGRESNRADAVRYAAKLVTEGAQQLAFRGVVSAGLGADDPAEPGQFLAVSDQFGRANGVYQVRGTSMTNVGILHGDYLAVRDNPAPASGEVVVAWIRDVGTVVKRLEIKAGNRYLCSEDGKDDPRYPHLVNEDDGDMIYGHLVGVLRVTNGPKPPPPNGRRKK